MKMLLTCLLATALVPAAVVADDDQETKELKAQVKKLQDQVAQLTAQLEASRAQRRLPGVAREADQLRRFLTAVVENAGPDHQYAGHVRAMLKEKAAEIQLQLVESRKNLGEKHPRVVSLLSALRAVESQLKAANSEAEAVKVNNVAAAAVKLADEQRAAAEKAHAARLAAAAQNERTALREAIDQLREAGKLQESETIRSALRKLEAEKARLEVERSLTERDAAAAQTNAQEQLNRLSQLLDERTMNMARMQEKLEQAELLRERAANRASAELQRVDQLLKEKMQQRAQQGSGTPSIEQAVGKLNERTTRLEKDISEIKELLKKLAANR